MLGDFVPCELCQHSLSAIFTQSLSQFRILQRINYAPCNIGGIVWINVVAALFGSTTNHDFAHTADACCADDNRFLHAHGFKCHNAKGFIEAWEHGYVACCVVEYAFLLGDKVEAEFN